MLVGNQLVFIIGLLAHWHLVFQPRIQNTMKITGAAGAITSIATGSANPVGFIIGPVIAGTILSK